MKKAIKEKLMNLIEINNNESSIKSNLTLNKQYDLYKVIEPENLKAFFAGETDDILIKTGDNLNNIERDLKDAANVEDYLAIVFDNGIELSEVKIKRLRDDFVGYRVEYLPAILKLCQNKRLQFINLNRTAKIYCDDTTVWPLYLAYGFLKGKLPDGELLDAPILLYSVEIIEKNNQLYIHKLEHDPVWNEKLELVIKKAYNKLRENKQSLDFANEESASFTLETIINEVQDIIGYTLNPIDGNINKFQKESDKSLSDYTDLFLEDSCLLGIFEPSGGALKLDLEKIIELDADPFDSEYTRLFTSEQIADKVLKNQSNIFEINSVLNIYQKYAVLSALNQDTLIYGPPGTGKSEVIANIIFNALINGSSSLLVSEKRAALDILTSRIGRLALFSLNLYDLKNKNAFYERISALNDVLTSTWFRDKKRGLLRSNIAINPLKLNPDELSFLKSYNEWFVELTELLKIHKKVEEYSDSIYKLDYSEFEEIKRKLGDALVNEWLSRDEQGKTLLEYFDVVYYKYNFLVVQDLFVAWNFYSDFVKKTRLLDTITTDQLSTNLLNLIKKIRANEKDVLYYLLNQNNIKRVISNNTEFENKYKDNEIYKKFQKLNLKEKNQYIDKIEEFLNFYKTVIKENFILQNKSLDEIKEISKKIDDFYSKYQDLIKEFNLINIAINNKYKISSFIKTYESVTDSDDKKIILSEFVINEHLLTQKKEIESSHLTIKEIKIPNQKADHILSFLKKFLEEMDILSIKDIKDLSKYLEFMTDDLDFYNELLANRSYYSNNITKILDKYEWLSIPYLKELYLNKGMIIFDYDELSQLMKKIPVSINQQQYEMLRIVDLWNKIIKDEKCFNELTGFHINDIFLQLRKNELKAAQNIEEIVYTKIIEQMRDNLSRLSDGDKEDLLSVFKISADKNSYPSITKFVTRYYKVLRYIFPIFVARPENVATLIPLQPKEFDYGIFDEASQMFIERAYPCVYRSKIKIISGDDKQLKPTSFFIANTHASDYDMDDFDHVNSLLERAKTAWWTEFNLKNHYRSDSKELIEFSNKYIYNNSLEVATKQGCYEKAIEVIDVDGIFDEGVNELEAKKVIELLKENHNLYHKILIVSFNAKQANYINKLVLEEYGKFDLKLQEKIDHDQVVITNLENVQGNEGDLVILSMTYGKNLEGKISTNFGPLITNGGSNRLNVAITRARKKMIIIKSLYGSQITVSNMKNNNAMIFKQFVEYADKEKNSISLSKQLTLDYINSFELNIENSEDINNVFHNDEVVKEIYSELIKNLDTKYKVIPNLNISNKEIALTIYNKDLGKIELLIIVEKWKENEKTKTFMEDLDRQFFLEDRGYATYRIKHYEWFLDKNKIITKLIRMIQPSSNEREPINVAVFAKKVLYDK